MKLRDLGCFLPAAALLLAPALLPAQQVFITREGAARAAIVYPREPSARLASAIEELLHYIQRMSGAGLDLRRSPAEGLSCLHLGVQELGDAFPDNAALAALNPEGFILRVAEGEAWLGGRSELGLQHGVYWLLEQWGCRWLFPGPAGEVVPDSPTLRIDRNMETAQQPQFRMRALWYNYGSHLPEDPKAELLEWSRRNRLDYSLRGSIGHSYNHIIGRRNSEVFAAHPEYFPRSFGFRAHRRGQICTGNEGVRELAVRYALEYFRRHPENDMVSLSPNDGAGPWRCPENRKYGSFSDAALDLANHVAKALAGNPATADKLVAVYAYLDTSRPPTLRARDNVIVFFATRLGTSPWRLRIGPWARQTTHLGIQDYASILPFQWTRPVWRLENLQRKVRIWRAHGAEAVNVESGNDWGGWGLYHYVLARLLWNPDEELEELFADYLAKGFGRSAPHMRRYFTLWRNGYSDWKIGTAAKAVQKALQAADSPEVRARIELYARYLQYLRLLADYQNAGRSEERERARRALIEAGLELAPTNMAHTAALVGRFLRGR